MPSMFNSNSLLNSEGNVNQREVLRNPSTWLPDNAFGLEGANGFNTPHPFLRPTTSEHQQHQDIQQLRGLLHQAMLCKASATGAGLVNTLQKQELPVSTTLPTNPVTLVDMLRQKQTRQAMTVASILNSRNFSTTTLASPPNWLAHSRPGSALTVDEMLAPRNHGPEALRTSSEPDAAVMSHPAAGMTNDYADDVGSDEEAQYDRSEDSFPFKLHRLLAHAEKEGRANVISFCPDGVTFMIYCPTDFVRDIMPLFFGATKLSSFHRQLNIYGYKRVSEGPYRGGFRHKNFIKGQPQLCKNIKRKTRSKGCTSSL